MYRLISVLLPPYVMVFLVFNNLRCVIVVQFVDVDGIGGHHCFSFLFIIHIKNIAQSFGPRKLVFILKCLYESG